MKKKIGWAILLIFVIIQFIQPSKNKSTEISPNDISKHYTVPENVAGILKRACNDCHSNNTVYPWYSHIQPVGWWLQHHVNEGKEHLNFSEFAKNDAKRQDHKLEEAIEEVKEGHMPLNSYLWIHKDAKLSEEDKRVLIDWANGLRTQIAPKL